MAIVSNLPFRIQVRNRYWFQPVMEAERFFSCKEEAWNCENSTVTIEENDEIELMFETEDSEARLYVEALYGIPKAEEIAVDQEGRRYCRPAKDYFYLYRSDDNYEPLWIDVFLITVFCEGQLYYGTLEVKPKQMDMAEWDLMRKELEEEFRGLTTALVVRNQGFSTEQNDHGINAPEKLSKFLMIKDNARQLTAALMDIADKPRSQIVTTYDNVSTERARVFDRETARRYVRTGGREATRRVPVKTVTYDIAANRMLKQMIASYEKALDEFIDWMDEKGEAPVSPELQQTAYKLRKLSALIKQKPWYKQVSSQLSHDTPQSFIMDSRYNTIYQIYTKLRKNEVRVTTKPTYAYAWKRSNLLYEMWCFIKVCQILSSEYRLEEASWDSAFGGSEDCPALISGTTIRFYNKEVELVVQYDRTLYENENQTNEKDPLYMVKMLNGGSHNNKPDITIQMYSREYGCYMGSVILECKYRKVCSFWRWDSQRSSIGQLQTYYNNARSSYLYNGMGNRFGCNPVHQVIALTPDIIGDEVEEYTDFNIKVKSFKPSKTEDMFEGIKQLLNDNVKKALKDCRFLLGEKRI
ncbi:MAG: DUF2357 domain-containing protein [bacterium]|nr:DUF2357 domain-containing protein [bacterium]